MTDLPLLLLYCRLLIQQLPRLLDAAGQGIAGATDALVHIASTAADIGGRACARGEPQPALDMSTQACLARALRRRLMTLVGEQATKKQSGRAGASATDWWLEAIGWPRILAAMLPQPERSPPITDSVAMHLTVGRSDATLREPQQVCATGQSVVHTHARGWHWRTRSTIMHVCARYTRTTRRRCSRR